MAEDTIQALLRKRWSDPGVAVKYGDTQWSWAQYLRDAAARDGRCTSAPCWATPPRC